MQPNQHRNPDVEERRFLRVADVRFELGCSKGHVFSLLKNGKLRSFKLDGLRLIDRASFEAYIKAAEPRQPRVKR